MKIIIIIMYIMTGHGFCIDCKSFMFQASERPNCPNCRLRLHDRDAHPLFLELVDAEVAFASNIVEGLNKMDHETPLLSIEKAGEKLTKVLQDPQSKSNDMVKLFFWKTRVFLIYFFRRPYSPPFFSPKRLHLSRLQKISTIVSFPSLPKLKIRNMKSMP